MFLSPNPRAHLCVLFFLTICVVSAVLAGIRGSHPVADASTSRETSAARPSIETSALAPPSTTIVVNSTADVIDTSDGLCTLREAITAANTDTASGATAGECAAGSGADTLDATGVAGTITLLTALPEISTSMSITGPGANLLTVARDSAVGTPEFRVLKINSGVTISITGLTIANGKLTGTDNGGGILNEGALTITSCNLYGNSVDHSGGAIYSNGASLIINDCQIGGLSAGQPNTSVSTGAGIYSGAGVLSITGGSVVGNTNGGGVFVAGGSATLDGTRTTNNSSFGGGGGVTNLNATTTVTNSLIAANSAINGAGVYNQGGTLHVANSTISGNTSSGAGGGARNHSGTLNLTNVTVTNNRTDNAGLSSGGISVSGTVNLRNTIVAGNFRGASPTTTASDISGSVFFAGNNLIGVGGSGGVIDGDSGNKVGVVNPGLGALADNGGSNQTHAALPGSPAIDAGNNCVLTICAPSVPSPITLDQRGAGFSRPQDGNGDGAATVDIGAYEVQAILVTNTNDSGAGSLRQAIIDANAHSDSSSIVFQPGVTGSISLSTALPDLITSMAINGPGAGVLTVQRSTAVGTPDFRIFKVSNGSLVVISGLTMTNGKASGSFPGNSGGGIWNDHSTLTIRDSIITGNTATFANPLGFGGGIYNDSSGSGSSTLTIINTTIADNSCGGNGGAIFNNGFQGNAVVTITNSTLASNTAGSGGGAIHASGQSGIARVQISNSAISGNTANIGAGISNEGTQSGNASLVILNTTVTGNNASAHGGGIVTQEATLDIVNGTITNNRSGTNNISPGSQSGGGMFIFSGNVKLQNTIVARNFHGSAGSLADDIFNAPVDPSSSFNLIGTGGSGGLVHGVNNNQVGIAEPLLAPLANNGGPTLTHALLTGSPAIDAGNNCVFNNSCSPALGFALTTDQRGFNRKVDGEYIGLPAVVDIGAFEFRASIQDITDKSTSEDIPLSFSFGVGDAAAITNVSASSSNATLVPNLSANINVTGSGSTRFLNITPVANQFGTSTITVTVTCGTESTSDTFLLTVTPVADVASVTNATTSMNTQTAAGLVITRNAVDSTEVTHFKITNITNGTLFKNDGTTQITNGSFITFAEGNAGLKFTPSNNLISPSSVFSFQVQGATSSGGAGLGPAATATITVDCGPTVVTNTNDSGPGSLRATINAACSGTNITFNIPISDPGFAGGVYHITLTSAELVINKNLTITGLGADVLTVRRSSAMGTPRFRIFTVASTITVNISGMTISNGSTADGVQPPTSSFGNSGDHGGGIMNSGVLTLTNMTITGNRTGNGSLPAASSSGSNFGGPGGFGAGVYSAGQLTMSNVTVSNNTTGNGVSAIFGGGGGRGGGIFILSGSLTMTNCVVSGNVTGIGAISTNGASSGSGGGGGGIYIQVGTTTITNTSIINNTTGNSQVASPSNSGSGGEGGGITISSGTSVDSGNITIANSTITGNRTGDGTGFAGQAGRGAGLNNGSSTNLTIIGSTISGNQTGNGLNGAEAGIGAGLSNTATTKLINTTISGNVTGSGNSGAGAGIWNAKNLFLTNSTVVLNSGGTFGGPGIHQFNDSSAVTLRNTIIAGNTLAAQPNAADLSSGTPAYVSQGHNLIGNANGATGFSPANGDQLGTMATPLNPRLAALGNYGGPTQTHALLPGSPALDAGNNCVNDAAHCSDPNIPQLTTDQRGFNRVVNSTVDIGAFESRGFTLSPTSGTPQSTVIGSTFAQPLVTTVSSAFAEPVAGGVITFSAPVLGASGTFPGSVTFITASTNGTGVATSPAFTANLIPGGYNVTAGARGINTPASFSLTNSPAPTSTSVSSSVNPSEFGESVTFTATISAAVGLTPTGTVQFKDGVTDLGSPVSCVSAPGNTCSAQLPISSLSVGEHNISATYSGDGNFDGSNGSLSSTQVVKPQPTLSINDVLVTESNSGTVNLTFTVTLSAASSLTVSAGYAPANGTATTADNDYQSTSGTVTFTPGDLTETVTIVVNGDQKTEPDETVFVVLSNPVNAAFSDSQGQGTIINDDDLQLLLDTSGPDANQLAALDSLLLTRDPFRVANQAPWLSSEQNTRVILFALNLNSAESPSNVKVMVLDGNGGTHEVAADDVRAMEGTAFTQVTFRLPDGLAQGTCLVSIKAHDRISNTGTFRVIP